MNPVMLLILCLLFPATLAASQTGMASFYGLEACEFNPHPKCPTANGRSLYELERKKIPYCASYDFPLGTRLELTRGKKSAECIVLDRGPNKRLGRKLDLSRRVFTRLGKEEDGTIEVKIRRVA